ncbi:hypothetical protein NDU88_002507 [Pleurodeles waltl]|uniref:Uncharacterized protein n=1 Tax=Pleurodeles waltl TaxID=8319 RepID=A0AAV7U9Z5_PLEWA|nr:hypothetical protein NDU88_002507 [Pleurodeles waltl]
MDRVAPLGGSRAPSARRAPDVPLTPTQAPGSSDRRRARPLRARLAAQFKLRSPLFRWLADLSSHPGPTAVNLLTRRLWVGGQRQPGRRESLLADRRRVAPPQSTWCRLLSSRLWRPGSQTATPEGQRLSFSLAGALRSRLPCWFLGRSCRDQRPGLTPRRQTPRQDPQGSESPQGQPGRHHQDAGQQFLQVDDRGVQSTLRVRPPS